MAEKVLMKGNEALAESALRAGCRFFFGYPITPQTELAAYMSKRMPKIGGTYLQAESEIAAINMVYGAASAGARAMTSSSSPGISLKGEGISYMAGSDLPGVIINVQRGGPGLGGIQPSQSDYWQATRATGHGDFFMPVLAPSTVQEMADCVYRAFDLADEYRTPVMVLADGMLGQMMEPVVLPEHKESLPEKPWATTGHKGKRAHNIVNSLYLTADALEKLNIERFERYEVIREKVQLGVNAFSDADIRLFFKDKQSQDEKVAEWTDCTLKRLGSYYKNLLYEAGLTDHGKTERRYAKPIIDRELEYWMKDNGLQPMYAALTGEN